MRLQGLVQGDPTVFLSAGLAESTSLGIRLLGNNGSGFLTQNGGGLIGKVKYRVADLNGHAERPIEGMAITAVALDDGSVLAGPATSGPDGTYVLSFSHAPDKNFRIVAQTPAKPNDPTYEFDALLSASPAASAVTDDTSRSLTAYILDLLPRGVQPVLNAHEQGQSAQAFVTGFQTGVVGQREFLAQFDALLAFVPSAKLQSDDPDGTLAGQMSHRAVALMDLSQPAFQGAANELDEIRRFQDTLASPPDRPLVDQIITFYETNNPNPGDARTYDLLKQYGMDPNRAAFLDKDLFANVNGLVALITQTVEAHPTEVMGPLAADLGPLIAAAQPSASP